MIRKIVIITPEALNKTIPGCDCSRIVSAFIDNNGRLRISISAYGPPSKAVEDILRFPMMLTREKNDKTTIKNRHR